MNFLKLYNKNLNGNFWGIFLTTLCAIHCALSPFIVFLFPVVDFFAFENEIFEVGILLTAILITGYQIKKMYSNHKNSWILLTFFTALLINFLSFLPILNSLRPIAHITGSILLAISLFWSLRETKNCIHLPIPTNESI